jgi:hypothetical protein
MVLYFRTRGEGAETVVGADPGTLEHHLSVAENFLKWALDSDNRGGVRALTLEELSAPAGSLGASVPIAADGKQTVPADSASE